MKKIPYIAFLYFTLTLFGETCAVGGEVVPLEEVLKDWGEKIVQRIRGCELKFEAIELGKIHTEASSFFMKNKKARVKYPNWATDFMLKIDGDFKYIGNIRLVNKSSHKRANYTVRWYHNSESNPTSHSFITKLMDEEYCQWTTVNSTGVMLAAGINFGYPPFANASLNATVKFDFTEIKERGNKTTKTHEFHERITLDSNKSARACVELNEHDFEQDYEINYKITGGIVLPYKKGGRKRYHIVRLKEIFGSGEYYNYNFHGHKNPSKDFVIVKVKGKAIGQVKTVGQFTIEGFDLLNVGDRASTQAAEASYQKFLKSAKKGKKKRSYTKRKGMSSKYKVGKKVVLAPKQKDHALVFSSALLNLYEYAKDHGKPDEVEKYFEDYEEGSDEDWDKLLKVEIGTDEEDSTELEEQEET